MLLRWCIERGITFTRTRPYRKDDNCFVEQKNWTHVRQHVGLCQASRRGSNGRQRPDAVGASGDGHGPSLHSTRPRGLHGWDTGHVMLAAREVPSWSAVSRAV